MSADLKKLAERYDHMKKLRAPYEPEWKEVSRYIIPRRYNWSDELEVTRPTIYDATAVKAAQIMANGLAGHMSPAHSPWFKLRFPSDEVMGLPGVRGWLEKCESVMYTDMARSNWYEQVNEVLLDGGGLGTACLYVEEDLAQGLPVFSSRHMKEVYIAVGQHDKVTTVFRRFMASLQQLVERFGLEKLSPESQTQYEKEPYARVPVIHAVYPREQRDQSKQDQKNKRFASVYWEEGQESLESGPLSEGGYDKLPYMILRWAVNSDETYARGLGFDAIPEVKKLNTIARDMLEASHKAVDPPVDAPEHRRNQISLKPGRINYYKNPNSRVFPIQTNAQYPIGLDSLDKMQMIVQQHFMVDFFLMLDQAPKGMTATEVMERQSEKSTILGTIIGRISSDLLDPVLDHVFAMAMKGGRLPAPPPALLMAAQQGRVGSIEPEYVGPLAQAQKRFHQQQGVRAALNSVLPLGQVFGPQTYNRIKVDEVVKHLLESGGMIASAIRSDREVRQLVEAQAKAQQQQQQMQREMAGAEQYQKLKDAPEEGSPMKEIQDQGGQP